jgi:ribonuclease HI
MQRNYTESSDDDVRTVLDNAHALLSDEVRHDPARWQRLVHPDFFQYGFGGSEITFDDLDEHFAKPLEGRVEMEVVSAQHLTDDVVLVRWKGRSPKGVVNRGSVWLRTDSGWRLRYQQGTRAEAGPPGPALPG